jgi:hypothetical protein
MGETRRIKRQLIYRRKKMSYLEKLTEGIRERSLAREGEALLEKWEKTGLLEGLGDDTKRSAMSRLLENQAAQLLKEASSMAAGDVEGFASVAFPIVRRVFGGLLAQDLVSVQPMSLPSGLVFFLDFTLGTNRGGSGDSAALNEKGKSIYGGRRIGSQLTGGIDLSIPDPAGTTNDASFRGGAYDLANGYSTPTGSLTLAAANLVATIDVVEIRALTASANAALFKRIDYDADLLASTDNDKIFELRAEVTSIKDDLNFDNLTAVNLDGSRDGTSANTRVVRRLTQHSASSDGSHYLTMIVHGDNGLTANKHAGVTGSLVFPRKDKFSAGGATGAVVGAEGWGLELGGDLGVNDTIPEIDIKVDSIAVTAMTRKLKAKWTPELAQDLNAYHNLDAEVELTSVLSEQVALEIDQEILNDLVQGATGGTLYWSRRPGRFLDRESGADITSATAPPDFTGTVSEWYETLMETINDVSARIHRKTLRGGANFIVCSPEVASILEFTAGFRAAVAVDDEGGSWGAQNVGSLSKKMDVYVDPYFPRGLVLVGRKGNSFLESGYVYAPYVPLQVTPTIFNPDTFAPTKAVMTRYAKQMVRSDMYGLVVCRDLVN